MISPNATKNMASVAYIQRVRIRAPNQSGQTRHEKAGQAQIVFLSIAVAAEPSTFASLKPSLRHCNTLESDPKLGAQ